MIWDKRGKRLEVLTLSAFVVLMAGCGKKGVKLYTPEQPIVFMQTESEEYDCMQLEANGKKYLPYCAADPSMCEEVIGYYDVEETEISEGGRIYVLSCKDLSSDEWIIDCLGEEGAYVSGHNEPMLLKEETVTDIPEYLQGKSEYEWNQPKDDKDINSDASQTEEKSPKEEAISIYDEAGGGSFATVQYNSTLASMTMTRCAELIEYINE